MQLTFGSGEVFAQMITDAYGNRVQNATPVRIMGLQEMSRRFVGGIERVLRSKPLSFGCGARQGQGVGQNERRVD